MKLKSINVQVSIMTTLVIVAAVTGLVWYVSSSSYQVARDMGIQMSEQSVAAAAKSLDNYMEGGLNVTENLAKEKAIANALIPGFSAKRAQKEFEEMMKIEKDYWAMFVFDLDGKVVAGANAKGKSLAGADRASRGYVKAILGGKDVHVTRTVLKSKSGGDILIFGVARAIRDRDGELLGGVAVFPLWEKYTERFIDPVRIGQSGYGFIFDPDGRIISHAVNKDLILKDLSKHEFTQKALAQKNGLVEYDWEGRNKIMLVQTNPHTGWVICMSVYEDDLASGAIKQRNVLLGVGLFMVLVVSGLLVFMLKKLVFTPLSGIERFSGEVAKGNLNAALEGVFKYEMENLSDHITHMVLELKQKLGFAEGVLTGLTQPCMVVDVDEKITFINEPYLALYERSETPEQALGMTVSMFFYGEEGRETMAGKCLREDCVMRDHEMESKTSKGKDIYIRYDIAPLYDLDDNMMGAFLLFFDLTEIKRNQALIEEKNVKIERAAGQADAVAEQMVAASEELSAQIEQSTRGAELQRERAAEAATAMEEMNATVLEVARNASEAAGLADESKIKAQDGSGVVERMVGTIVKVHENAVQLRDDMAELGKQAEGIGQIMNVITDIADQTNLLALNAAIEAARAGEAGRGFAVVADEVRKLAEKTMTATQEVGSYIKTIQQSAVKNVENTEKAAEAINESTAMANESGEALQEIVGLIERTADQVRNIATASEEQSATSEEISRATSEINQIAMETAQAMGESKQAIEDLARVSTDLKGAIDEMQD